MKQRKKEALVWLERAVDDLSWTKANINAKIYYGACFSAQQAAEKALKAFLLYQKGKFGKVHDLVKLLDECARYQAKIKSFRKKVAKLSFYYIQTRYPDIMEVDKFTKEEAEEALSISSKLIDFVSKILNKARI